VTITNHPIWQALETGAQERMMKMGKRQKTASENQWFLRKYCFAKSYPASDIRCPYAKATIIAKPGKISSGGRDTEKVDGIFLCRYPNAKMPLHEARLTSELDQCPNPERRNLIDTLYKKGV
jgi:hypothetical protein